MCGSMKLLLTGGCGFIGSAVVRHLLRRTDHVVINVDKMTYAASEDALEDGVRHNRHLLIRADIADPSAMRLVFETHDPDAVMHLAAESHVDRSIDGPADFVQTNVVGTFIMLEAARRHHGGLSAQRQAAFRFHHVSTDEVFGALKRDDPPFTEITPYDPRSPYSATKAASDHLVRAWSHTYKLPTIVSNTCNNYGPWQFPEKLIPLVTLNALDGKELPVYGDGRQMRDWLFVEDHAEALVRVVQSGTAGETYAIGGRQPRTNLQVVKAICAYLAYRVPAPAGPRERLIRFVADRPGHDFRYEIDPSRSEQALDWKAPHDFERGLARTIDWYLANPVWWQALRTARYAGHRLGKPGTGDIANTLGTGNIEKVPRTGNVTKTPADGATRSATSEGATSRKETIA
jgi:dTDP-glucose 4,6-dehydratase